MNRAAQRLPSEEPWQVAIGLAWEAYVGGNVGVGAAITDRQGQIVAAGRNRMADIDAPPGRLRSTFIAHAELDVLGQLAPGDYRDHTLWTTLEPCLLCSAAIVMSNIGSVTFVAKDRLWDDISRLAELNDFVAKRWPARRGPLDGPLSVFCELLPLLWFVENKSNGTTIQRYQSHHPRLLELAKVLVNGVRFPDLRAQPLDTVLDQLWTALEAVDDAQSRR